MVMKNNIEKKNYPHKGNFKLHVHLDIYISICKLHPHLHKFDRLAVHIHYSAMINVIVVVEV